MRTDVSLAAVLRAFMYYRRFYYVPEEQEENDARSELEHLRTLMTAMRSERASEAALTHEDVLLLVNRGFVKELEAYETPLGFVNAFAVLELKESGARRRLVCEPHYNDCIMADLQTRLPSPSECVEQFATASTEARSLPGRRVFAFCADFSFWYGQIRMDECAQLLHCFQKNGRWYKMLTVPTGGRGVVPFAQALTSAITAGLAGVSTAYIDNMRVLNTCAAAAIEDVLALVEFCDKVGAVLNETVEELIEQLSATEHTFLGITYTLPSFRSKEEVGNTFGQYTRPAVRVADKTKHKLADLATRIGPDMTLADASKWRGVVAFADAVMSFDQKCPYYVRKFLRARFGRGNTAAESRIRPWPSILSQWRAFAKAVMTHAPRHVDKGGVSRNRAKPRLELWTDASKSGWGFVAAFENHAGGTSVLHMGGPWLDADNVPIHELELQALIIAVDYAVAMAPTDRRHAVYVKVDNTAVRWAVQRWTSKSFWMDVRLRHLKRAVGALGDLVSIEYVHTSENIADYASRLFEATRSPLVTN